MIYNFTAILWVNLLNEVEKENEKEKAYYSRKRKASFVRRTSSIRGIVDALCGEVGVAVASNMFPAGVMIKGKIEGEWDAECRIELLRGLLQDARFNIMTHAALGERVRANRYVPAMETTTETPMVPRMEHAEVVMTPEQVQQAVHEDFLIKHGRGPSAPVKAPKEALVPSAA